LQPDGAVQLVNGASRISVRSNAHDELAVHDFDLDASADGVAFAWVEDYTDLLRLVRQRLVFRRYSADFAMFAENLDLGEGTPTSKVAIARMTQGGVRFAIAIETQNLQDLLVGRSQVRVYTVDANGADVRSADFRGQVGTTLGLGGIITVGDRFWLGTTARGGGNEAVLLQRLDRNATLQGEELNVSGGVDARSAPGLARTADGGALVAWRQREGNDQGGIYVSRITSAFGRVQDNGVRIGSTLGSSNAPPVVRDGRMVVWRNGDAHLVGQARVGDFLCLPQ
jgi:hypothetical protein